MADYRRFLSYIYAYDGDYKMNGTGFAKVEVRDGRYRLTVNLGCPLPGQGKNYHVAVYGGSLDKPVVADIGVIEQKGGSYFLKLSGMVQEFAAGKVGLDDAAGLVIYREAGSRIHITSWKDPQTGVRALREGIYNLKNHCEGTAGKQDELSLRAASKADGSLDKTEISGHGPKLKEESEKHDGDSIKLSKEPDKRCEEPAVFKAEAEDSKADFGEFIEEPSELKAVFEDSKEASEEYTEEPAVFTAWMGKHSEEPAVIRQESGKHSEEPAAVKEESEKCGKVPEESGLVKEDADADSRLQSETVDGSEDVKKEYDETDRYKNIIIIDSKRNDADSEAKGEAVPVKEQEKQLHTTESGELWHEFKRMYPKIRPFDDKGWEVLQIKLQDIGRLCRENWILGNNNFVLHGYYKYGYLILARKHKPDMDVYILGVPGVFSINEKFMASMFGMTDFMESNSKRPDLPKNFGYWCTHIDM